MKRILITFAFGVIGFSTSFAQTKTTAIAEVSSVAGSTQNTAGSANGQGINASFNGPKSVATDASGNVYVADFGNHLIRKITPTGIVSTLAGNGIAGSTDGQGNAARFNGPSDLAVDNSGNIYVADAQNNLIRKISSSGAVSTFAGSGAIGDDDGQDVLATFNNPTGVAVDKNGNVYVSDQSNNLIRKISPAGLVSTLAGLTGNGFNGPKGITVDSYGNVYVTDYWNNAIKKITAEGIVSTLAGSLIDGHFEGAKDGQGSAANFWRPTDITVDIIGNLYVADGFNLIRKITPEGLVSTLAGNQTVGSVNGATNVASFNTPYGVALDDSGNVYVADYGNNLIRKIYYIYQILPVGHGCTNNWMVGDGIALAYNTSPPMVSAGITPVPNNNDIMECATSMSDVNGNFLFATSGQNVYSANKTLAGTILTDANTAQGAAIIPVPGSTNKYYITAVSNGTSSCTSHSPTYSTVQVNGFTGKNLTFLNKNDSIGNSPNIGQGQLIAPQSDASGNLTGNYWLAFHERDSNGFFVYLVTSTGFVQQNKQFVGPIFACDHGAGASSPDALGFAKMNTAYNQFVWSTYHSIMLFNFDNKNGSISFVDSANVKDLYGIEFSPAGNYIYNSTGTSVSGSCNIWQTPVNNTGQGKVLGTTTMVGALNGQIRGGALQLASDGNIYCASFNSWSGASRLNYIGAILNPNGPATFNPKYVQTASGIEGMNLPNFIVSLVTGNDANIKIPYSGSNDLPTNPANLSSTTVQDTTLNYISGRNITTQCGTLQSNTNVIDAFYTFVASASSESLLLTLDNPAWVSALELIDTSGYNSVSNECNNTLGAGTVQRTYIFNGLNVGQKYEVRLELGGTNPLGYTRVSSLGNTFTLKLAQTTGVSDETLIVKKTVYKIYNVQGQEVNKNYPGLLIYQYTDGSTEKIVQDSNY